MRDRGLTLKTSAPAVAMALGLPLAVAAQSDYDRQNRSQGQEQAQSQDSQQSMAAAEAETEARAATVNNIVDDPAGFYGEKVTVTGPVGEVFGRQVFNIEEQGVLDIDDELLVVAPANSPEITEESNVRVTGTIRQLTTAELEGIYGPRYWTYWGVGSNFFVDYDQKPVLYGDSVETGVDLD